MMTDAEIRARARQVAEAMSGLMAQGIPTNMPLNLWLTDWLATFGQAMVRELPDSRTPLVDQRVRDAVRARDLEIARMAEDTGINELIRFAQILRGDPVLPSRHA